MLTMQYRFILNIHFLIILSLAVITILTIKRSTYIRACGPLMVHMCGCTYYCTTATTTGVVDGNARVLSLQNIKTLNQHTSKWFGLGTR